MAVVRWTREARANLDDILTNIERHNPMAAVDLAEAIIASGNALATLPKRNPIRHEGELRERLVLGTRYVLLYRVEQGDAVQILAVRHGARASRIP
ncbi:MAG: type II toxin-antitoxin system RelE/ParE family toxin [Rhodospirillaceae bacterium]|nr:type II toxin-antitoxin system RelE/ParE family toxin [Rhodospirillaceae bacterium]